MDAIHEQELKCNNSYESGASNPVLWYSYADEMNTLSEMVSVVQRFKRIEEGSVYRINGRYYHGHWDGGKCILVRGQFVDLD